jgi:hypothetical protein
MAVPARRLTRFPRPRRARAGSRYNALGQRVRKWTGQEGANAGSDRGRYGYDEAGRLLTEVQISGGVATQDGLAAARAANLTPFEAWATRRTLGATLKAQMRNPWRWWAYHRYDDALGPLWDPASMRSVTKTLSDTNAFFDTILYLPRTGMAAGGAVLGGGLGSTVDTPEGCGCQP